MLTVESCCVLLLLLTTTVNVSLFLLYRKMKMKWQRTLVRLRTKYKEVNMELIKVNFRKKTKEPIYINSLYISSIEVLDGVARINRYKDVSILILLEDLDDVLKQIENA